ncbi:MAG: Ig-like domain-containing protein [Candidatus Latescibacteria bacterium]|nr:Ig-like domain-containing protein [Candidatus Latescibacterota bacterium]
MKKEMFVSIIVVTFFCLVLPFLAISGRAEAIIAGHQAAADFELIPDSVIQAIGDDYLIFYGHTSHGSQIMTGLTVLFNEDPLYDPPYFHEYGDDLGHNGDTTWAPPTRNWLDAHPDYNMVMWSWCGGCSDNTEEGINIYLAKMEELEADYPDVIFIYMTGHLDGSGPEGNLYARNNQIRDYCVNNHKILFDFADIESYDPDGNYYPYGGDGCEWCYDWCDVNPCPSCGCAHSHCFNCYQKGKAWWWMMARIWGWNSEQDSVPHIVSTIPEQNELNVPDSTDISATFDLDMDEITINNSTFVVNAQFTGLHQGTITYDSLTKTAMLDPDSNFAGGEVVNVVLTTDIQSLEGIPLDSSYAWSFTIMVDRGDCNGDRVIDIGDVVYLVNYLYKSGPNPPESGDVNCDGVIDLGDVVYLINYLFKGGPPPKCC